MITTHERELILKEFTRLADEGEALAAKVQKVAQQFVELDSRETLDELRALTEKLQGRPRGNPPRC